MNRSTPGLPVHHQLPESTQTIHPLMSRWCHPTISSSVVPFSCCPQSFPASGSFPMNRLFASILMQVAKVLEAIKSSWFVWDHKYLLFLMWLLDYWVGWSRNTSLFSSVQFTWVAQSWPTLCNPMNCSTPGLPVHHQLPEFTQTHCQLIRWCHPTISSSVVPFSCCLQSFPASGFFQMSQLFTSGGQSIGISAISVLPMNTQDWSHLGWTGWISLQSKGLSRVCSNTTVQKHQFFGTQLSL